MSKRLWRNMLRRNILEYRVQCMCLLCIEYLIVTIVFSGYVFCTWQKRASLQDLLMERMLEPPSMKAGARVKIHRSPVHLDTVPKNKAKGHKKAFRRHEENCIIFFEGAFREGSKDQKSSKGKSLVPVVLVVPVNMCELAGMEDVWLADLPSLWPGRDTVVQCRSSWKFECVWNWNSFVCYWTVLNVIEYWQPNIESDGITGMLEEVVPGLCRHLIGSQGARCLGVSLWQPHFALPMSSLLLKTKAWKTGRGCGFPLLFNARAALQSPWLGRATAAQAEWHRGYWAYNLIRQDASNKWKWRFQDVSIHASFWRISLKGIQQTCGATWWRH